MDLSSHLALLAWCGLADSDLFYPLGRWGLVSDSLSSMAPGKRIIQGVGVGRGRTTEGLPCSWVLLVTAHTLLLLLLASSALEDPYSLSR